MLDIVDFCAGGNGCCIFGKKLELVKVFQHFKTLKFFSDSHSRVTVGSFPKIADEVAKSKHFTII